MLFGSTMDTIAALSVLRLMILLCHEQTWTNVNNVSTTPYHYLGAQLMLSMPPVSIPLLGGLAGVALSGNFSCSISGMGTCVRTGRLDPVWFTESVCMLSDCFICKFEGMRKIQRFGEEDTLKTRRTSGNGNEVNACYESQFCSRCLK